MGFTTSCIISLTSLILIQVCFGSCGDEVMAKDDKLGIQQANRASRDLGVT